MQRLVMNEPGWWTHTTVIQPARIKTHRLEHGIVRGSDPDVSCGPTANGHTTITGEEQASPL
jgi:hypothetical protein